MLAWESLLGFQFENLILSHIPDLFPHLGLDSSLVLSAAPYARKGGAKAPGLQIELNGFHSVQAKPNENYCAVRGDVVEWSP